MYIPDFFRRSELSSTLWRFRQEFAVCVVFSMLINVLMLAPTLYMLQVYDRVMASRSGMTLLAMTVVAFFLFALTALAEWLRSHLLVRAGLRLDSRLNRRVFGASFEAQLAQAEQGPGEAFAHLTHLRQFLTGSGLFAFLDAPWTPIYIAVLCLLHPGLGILATFFVALLAGLAWYGHRTDSIDRANEAARKADAFLHSKLRNVDTIEALGMRGNLRHHWHSRHRRHQALHSLSQTRANRVQSLTRFVRYSQQSLILGAGALLVIQGKLTPGAMIAASIMMARALQPVEMLVDSWKSLVGARTAFLGLEKLLACHPESATGQSHPAPRGHVRLDNLVATAPGRPAPILKGLTAEFPAGSLVAVVGPSGSGKSTLARTLVGIWPQTEGRVLLDGKPIQAWNREELGPHLGYLPQDIELFEGSIAENISRFGPVESDQVIRAARRAGIHDMILRLPQGYDTPMGEAGHLLSGGQGQRMALARAMYGEPSLVVLDEPNSNLDDAGEVALIQAIQNLKAAGKTVFLITHRMNIIDAADVILVLRDGAIHHCGPARTIRLPNP